MNIKNKLLKLLLGRHHEKLYWRKIEKNKAYINSKLDELGIGKGDVVVDLGANIGLFSECCLDRGAKVYAYEPNPLAAAELVRRLGKNESLDFHQAAVSEKSGKMKLFFHKHHEVHPLHMSESSSLYGDKVNVSTDYHEVDCIAIEDVLTPLTKISLVKVDVEGAEYELADGIISNIGKIDKVVMETHAARIPSLNKRHEELVARVESDPLLKQKVLLDWM
jgi:FkbM family methyltransferase